MSHLCRWSLVTAGLLLVGCGTRPSVQHCYQTRAGHLACVPDAVGLQVQALDIDDDGQLDAFVCANGTAPVPDAGVEEDVDGCGAGQVAVCHVSTCGCQVQATRTLCVPYGVATEHVREHGDRVGRCESLVPPCQVSQAPDQAPVGGQCGPNQVKLCHRPVGNPEQAHTLCVGEPSLKAHLAEHDDWVGPCAPAVPAPAPDAGAPVDCAAVGPETDSDLDGVPDLQDCDSPCRTEPAPVDAGVPSAEPDAGVPQGGGDEVPLDAGVGEVETPPVSLLTSASPGAEPTASALPPLVPQRLPSQPTVGVHPLEEKGGYAGWALGCSASRGRSGTWAWLVLASLALLRLRARRFFRSVLLAGGLVAVSTALPAEASEATSVAGEWSSSPNDRAHGRFHLLGNAFTDLVSTQTGLELGASFALSGHWDVGAALVLGGNVGYRALAEWHPIRPGGAALLPFVQLRGVVHPVSDGVGVGVGTWAGASVEAGPGRLRLGVLAEGYLGPSRYHPYAAFFMAGYEFDLFKPQQVVEYRERVTEVVRERTAPAPVRATVLRVQVTDLDDRPLEATVRVTAVQGAGAPVALEVGKEAALAPGVYRAEVSAPGYLAGGARFALEPGETRVEHFRLRPVPVTPAAVLTAQQIEIKQRVEFEFDKAVLLAESFSILDEVVDLLMRHPDVTLRVEGHTCSIGTDAYNQHLSDERAAAVSAYLRDKGVASERLQAVGYGKSRPLIENLTEEARALNRRVQFSVLSGGPADATASVR